LDVSDADAASDAIELDSVLQCIGISSGDFTGDGLVSFSDFLVTAAGYGGPASGFTSGDTNADGVVDFLDMMRVVDIFGTSGYAPPPPAPIVGANPAAISFSLEVGTNELLMSTVTAPVDLLGLSVTSPLGGLTYDDSVFALDLVILTQPTEVALAALSPHTLSGQTNTGIIVDPSKPFSVSWAVGSQVFTTNSPIPEATSVLLLASGLLGLALRRRR
jgi:MprA protease rhombosortase-interaction domain-containing protein